MGPVRVAAWLLLCSCFVRGEREDLKTASNSSYAISQPASDVIKGETWAQLVGAALARESWTAAERDCARRLRRALAAADDFALYAVWMLDAMQLPSGQLFGSESHLGNYDECLEPRWRHSHPQLSTQYCLADVRLVVSQPNKDYVPNPELSAETYLKTRTKHDLDLGLMHWGLCLPGGCPASAAAKVYRVLLRSSHWAPLAAGAEVAVQYCEEAGQHTTTNTGVKAFGAALMVLLLLAAAGTARARLRLRPDSHAHEILRSFCLKRNFASLTSVRDDEIYSINLMRIVTCVLVVCAHHFLFITPKLVVNGLHVEKTLDENGSGMIHGSLLVDTFFAISGLLLVRGYLGGKLARPAKVLFKRYMRFISVLGVTALAQTFVLHELGSGPLWRRWLLHETEVCRQYVWAVFAMLQNHMGIDGNCTMHAWSVAVDFHVSALGVLLCALYARRARSGAAAFALACLVLLPIPGFIQNKYNLPILPFYGLEAVRDMRANENLPLYNYPHTRAGAFLVGMALGWLLVKYRPEDYRRRLSQRASFVCLALCLALMCAVVALGGGRYYAARGAAGAAAYTSLNRPAFAAAVCGVIALGEYGDLGVLSQLFRWSPLVPLARLTFGVYLLHGLVVWRNGFVRRVGATWDLFSNTTDALGVAVASFFFSFVLYLLLEAPTMNLSSYLLRSRTSKQDTKTDSTPTQTETSSGPSENKKSQ